MWLFHFPKAQDWTLNFKKINAKHKQKYIKKEITLKLKVSQHEKDNTLLDWNNSKWFFKCDETTLKEEKTQH